MTELLDPKEALIDIYCKQLKLPGLKAHFRDLARDAMTQNETPTSFLAAALAKEIEARAQRRLTTRLKQSRFHELKTIEGFDFTSIPKLPKHKMELSNLVES